MSPIRFTILGEPASKANSRQIVTIGDRPSVIKSKKARDFERDALRQIPPAARVGLTGDVWIVIRIWYASNRPDLDESVVLDVLQNRYKGKGADRVLVQRGVYVNDRQVKDKRVIHHIDRINPRVEIACGPLEMQQPELPLAPVVVDPLAPETLRAA